MVAELALHFEFDDGTNLDEATKAVIEKLNQLEAVSEVAADIEKPRVTGLEIAGAIAVTIQILTGARKAVKLTRKLLIDLKGLGKEIKGLRNLKVEIGPKMLPIADLTEGQLQQLIEEDVRKSPKEAKSSKNRKAGKT
jgi:hypothetical protein